MSEPTGRIAAIYVWRVWDRVRYAWRWFIRCHETGYLTFDNTRSGMFADEGLCVDDALAYAKKKFGEDWAADQVSREVPPGM